MRAAMTPQALLAEVGKRLQPLALAAPEKVVGKRLGVSRAGAGRLRQGTAPGLSHKLLYAIHRLPPAQRVDALEPVLGEEVADVLRILSDLQSSFVEGRHALDRLNALIGGTAGSGEGAEGVLLGLARGAGESGRAVRKAAALRRESATEPAGVREAARAPEGRRVALASVALSPERLADPGCAPLARQVARLDASPSTLALAIAGAAADPEARTGIAYKPAGGTWILGHVAATNSLPGDPALVSGRPVASLEDRAYAAELIDGFDRAAEERVQLFDLAGVVCRRGILETFRSRVLRTVEQTVEGITVLRSRFVPGEALT